MSRIGLRMSRTMPRVQRPLGVMLLAGSGALAGIALAVLAIAWIAYRAMLGIPLNAQTAEVAFAILAPLLIIRLYWGVWDMMNSAWWRHIIGGPFAALGLIYVLLNGEMVAAFVMRDLPLNDGMMAMTLLMAFVCALLAIEIAMMVYLLAARRLFGVGVPKKAWER